jgi:hypothetical protein
MQCCELYFYGLSASCRERSARLTEQSCTLPINFTKKGGGDLGQTEFVKDIGKKIFGQGDEASPKIKDYMEAENLASRTWGSISKTVR